MLLIKVKYAGWRKAASGGADFEDSTERARWKRLSGDHHLHLLLLHHQGNVKKQAISVMLAWHWILSFSSIIFSSFSSSAGWLQPSGREQQSRSRLDMPVKSRNEAMRIWKGTAKWKDREINRQNGGEGGIISVLYLKFLCMMSCVLFIVESVRRSQI